MFCPPTLHDWLAKETCLLIKTDSDLAVLAKIIIKNLVSLFRVDPKQHCPDLATVTILSLSRFNYSDRSWQVCMINLIKFILATDNTVTDEGGDWFEWSS